MKLYELFKGTEYIGEFTLDEIIGILPQVFDGMKVKSDNRGQNLKS